MKPEWMKFLPVWEQPGEGGQGTSGESASGEGTPSTPGEGGGDQPPGGEGGDASLGSPSQRSSIMDFAPKAEGGKGEQVPEGDAWKLPEGLEIADHLVGSSAEDTLRKLHTAYKGARQELSSRKKEDGVLEGSVPGKIDGYTFDSIEGDRDKDVVLADLTSEESKPYVDAFREVAMEVGIPDAAFAKLMHGAVGKLVENGLSISTDPEQAMQINGEAEMEALTRDLGPQGANDALRQIDTFAQKLANNGILQNEKDVQEFAQMVGTAQGLQIMQRIIVAEFGEKAIPKAEGVAGAPTLEEAYEQHRQALSMPPGSDREEAVSRAEKQLEKAMAQGSTPGAVRSRVL